MTVRSPMLDLVVFALSIHADYRCHQSGMCCTSDWDVPVEVPLYRTLTDAIAAGRLSPAAVAEEGYPTFLLEPDLPAEAAAMIGRTSSGNCVFFHSRSGLCVIHRDLGEPQLPVDVPPLSATRGARSARHVHLAHALLSDRGRHAVPRRRERSRSWRTPPRFRPRSTRDSWWIRRHGRRCCTRAC